MANSINGSGALGTGSLAEAMTGGAQPMDREAFLKLLVAQLQHQDPLEPQKNSDFVAQLAQFSNLEQAIGMNDRLDALTLQSQGMANTEVVNLAGKNVTVRGNIASIDGTGSAVPIRFSLDSNADSIEVRVQDQSGRVVRTLSVPPQSAGVVATAWDGKNDAGIQQPPGAYAISVKATQGEDIPVGVSLQSTGRVDAVSFDRGFPVLHLSTGLSVPVADLLRVEPSSSNP